jgi:hypothetical protein
MKAYEDILTRNRLPVDIMLFIDALDEYDGPSKAIIDFIPSSVRKSSTQATNLKICFSSREWDAFDQSFSDGPGFRIHEHTKDDIRRYISSRLSSHPNISVRLDAGGEQEQLDIREMENDLAYRANGVFIWVRAVIDEMHRLFSQNTPTYKLLEYLKGVPDDLDRLYTDSIMRLPHVYRREAYYMFEVMRRSDRALGAIFMKETVLCAEATSISQCIEAINDNRKSQSFTQNPYRWVIERGAGLIEIEEDATPLVPNAGRVQFIHQTVLDFLSRPGFRSLVLGQAFELPRENGYSFLAKWQFALLEAERFGKLDSEVGPPARSSDGKSLAIQPATDNLLALAEQTSGKSMKYFLESVDAKAIRSELETLEGSRLEYDTSHIVNPLLSFSALQSLTILLGDSIQKLSLLQVSWHQWQL